MRSRPRDEDDDDDLVGPRTGGTRAAPRPRRAAAASRRRPSGGARRARWEHDSVRSLVRDIPRFGKLLWGLARDPRVSKTDKALVVGVLVYAALPADVIPTGSPAGRGGRPLPGGAGAQPAPRQRRRGGAEHHWTATRTLDTLLEALDSASELLPGPFRASCEGAARSFAGEIEHTSRRPDSGAARLLLKTFHTESAESAESKDVLR